MRGRAGARAFVRKRTEMERTRALRCLTIVCIGALLTVSAVPTSSIAHFEENLGAASIRLDAEELRTLAAY